MISGEEISLKILMIGDSGVGKSRSVVCKLVSLFVYLFTFVCSLLLRFTDNHYDSDQPSTIGKLIICYHFYWLNYLFTCRC